MRAASKTAKVFYADDGARFLDEEACRSYEAEQATRAKRLEDVRFFVVAHSADTTEGRGWSGCLHVAVETGACGVAPETLVHAACMALFGAPLAFVQGSSPIDNWRARPSTLAAFAAWRTDHTRLGDIRVPANALFISNGPPVEGWPMPVRFGEVLRKDALRIALDAARGES